MFEKIAQIVADQLNANVEEITMETNFKDDLSADSLDLFELVTVLEEEYDIEIDTEDLSQLTTVKAVMDYLTGKGIA